MRTLSKIIFVLCFVATAANAQNRTHMLGIGTSRVLDTYLTPEHFSGTGFTYLFVRDNAPSDTLRRWTNTYQHEMDFSNTEDRSGNTGLIEGTYHFYWARYYNIAPVKDLRLQVGAAANASIGFLYNMTSSNNPAQARASLNLMPSATATYQFRIHKQRFTARYELNLPLVGLMFSPNYGQSYYEIFQLGNYDHNVVPTTFVSAPTFRQMATIDWHYSAHWALRVGYLGNYQQSRVNNLKNHIYSHRLMIGFSRSL